MPNDTLKHLSELSEHDLLVILEAARMTLYYDKMFNLLADNLDLSDDVLIKIREDVNKFIEDEV